MEKGKDFSPFRHGALEYWETWDGRQCGVIGHIDEKGLSVRSHVNMRVGGELRIRIFLPSGYEFDVLQVVAKIVGKGFCSVEGWEAYEYELELIRMSEEDRLKLKAFLEAREAGSIEQRVR